MLTAASELCCRYCFAIYFELKPEEVQDETSEVFYKMLKHFMSPENEKFREKRLKFIPVVTEVGSLMSGFIKLTTGTVVSEGCCWGQACDLRLEA